MNIIIVMYYSMYTSQAQALHEMAYSVCIHTNHKL